MAKKAVKKASTKKEPSRRRARAKKADGTFMADDPSTPEVNEAFVPAESDQSFREAQRAKPAGPRSSYTRLGGELVSN